MTQANNQDRQTRAIKKTICIGLGGTGRDVLMRIRRFIIDRYGNLSEIPVISFVQIDTDKDSFNSSGLPTGNTYHGEEILFRDAEKVITNMTSQDVDNLINELEHKTLFESAYSHIESWFHPKLKEHIKAIEDGAHGIRPVGRLAFFHNYRQIQKAVDAADIRTRGHEAFLLKKGFHVQDGLDIFVVGSLCGGTGSGMFLDVAYSLRNLYRNNTQFFGYLVISPKLFGDTPIMNANTYAALQELNYYTTESSTFEACYDKQQQVIVREKRPPFDYTYLISNRTSGDYKVSEKSKLCNVIAYKIFLEFSSELASKLQGQRNNFRDPMLKPDEHPFKMSQRYLTFGLSAIYFTRDRLVQIALNRLTFKLIQFWLEGVGQSPESQDLLERFLLKWTADKKDKDCFTSKLEEATQENNKNFIQSLNKWRTSFQELEGKNAENIEKLKQDLPRELRSEFRKVQAGETESSRGSWLTNLQRVQPSLAEKFKNDIDLFLEELLNPDNSDFSVNSSLAFLEALRTQINQYKRLIEERKQDLKGMYPPERIDKIWADVKQEIEDIEQKPKLRIPFMKNEPNSKIQEVMLNAIQNGAQSIQHNFNVAVNEEALKIVEVLQKQISNRLNQLQAFSNLVQNIKMFYQKQEDELRQLNFDEMSGEAIFPEEDIEQCIPSNGSRSQLVSIGHEITKDLGLGMSLFTLLKTTIIDEQQLRAKTDVTIERLFGSVSLNQVQSVIKRFMNSYAISDRAKRLEQILQSSQPLLPLNLTEPRFYNGREKNIQLIGFKHTDDLEVKQFKNILTNELGISATFFNPIQAEDEILLITEYAAFPLRIINDVSQMKEYYKMHKEGGILHNNYTIMFTDIIPTEAKKVEELEYVLYPCLAFDLLNYNPVTQMYEFQCYDNLRRTYYTASLSSNWREALEQLAERKDMTDILESLLNQAVAEIERQPNLIQDYYPKVQQFVSYVENLTQEEPNFVYKAKVIGQRATLETSAQEGIVTRFIAQIEDRIKQKQPPTGKQLLPDKIISTTIENSNRSSEDNQLSELEKLIAWKNQGSLSQEEFEAWKKKLLGH
jgi:hypothetical protein